MLEDPVWLICLMQMARLLEEYKGAGNVDSSHSPYLRKSISGAEHHVTDDALVSLGLISFCKIAARVTAGCMHPSA